jgi:hypothetical protein
MSWNTDQRTTHILEQSRSLALQSAITQAESEAMASKTRLASEQAAAAARLAQNANHQDRQIISALRREVEAQQNKVFEKQIELEAAQRSVQERGNILTDWMHSNDAFKTLARKYGRKLGVTDEQRQKDYFEAVLNLAEENPAYDNTPLKEKAKRGLGQG